MKLRNPSYEAPGPVPVSRASLCAAAALLVLPYLAIGFWVFKAEKLPSLAAYAATVLLLELLMAFASGTWRRFFLLQTPLLLLSAAFAVYTLTYDNPPGYAIAYVLVTSSWDEMLGFFTIWQGERIMIAALVIIVAYVALALRLPQALISSGRAGSFRWSVLGAAALLSAYAGRSSADLMDGAAANPLVGSALFVAGPLINARASLHGAAVRKIPYGASRLTSDEVHILVIGESSRRDSWSVYGYSRRTTPFLERVKGEAIFFTNAVADANLTTYAVPMLLTGMRPNSFDLGAIHGNLIDLAKEAGYSTAWLMNQDIGVSLLVGIAADRMVYPNVLSSGLGRLPYDGALLPTLRSVLAHRHGPLFVGLHVIGSHWEYFSRYPPAFQRFGSDQGLSLISAFVQDKGDARVVNAYDDSILYTDWFLSQVIGQARELNVPATVTYISDHGEDLYALDGRAGHGTPTYSAHQFEIPAFVWLNDAYRRAHPEKVRAIEQNAAREIRSHNVFYSLADLMGIRWPGSSPTESFASVHFVPDAGMKVIAGGRLVAPN